MLIDATHAEETRVAVVSGHKLEEFDIESSSKKQLKGNVYLAKVTRVEPSLQAAFVEYGGNRHGFLASNEIHPDYYQIPVSDREKLVESEPEVEDTEEPVDGASVEVVGGDEIEEEVERRRTPLRAPPLRRRHRARRRARPARSLSLKAITDSGRWWL